MTLALPSLSLGLPVPRRLGPLQSGGVNGNIDDRLEGRGYRTHRGSGRHCRELGRVLLISPASEECRELRYTYVPLAVAVEDVYEVQLRDVPPVVLDQVVANMPDRGTRQDDQDVDDTLRVCLEHAFVVLLLRVELGQKLLVLNQWMIATEQGRPGVHHASRRRGSTGRS